MKKFLLLASIISLWHSTSFAVTLKELLDAVEKQPGHEVAVMSVQESIKEKDRATAALFPKLGAFGRYERYNSPTNLRPMPPTEVNVQAGDSIPFSREILRYGLTFDAPLYVHELYVLRKKAAILQGKSEIDRQLDLVRRQASAVSLNSVLTYLTSLEGALKARRASLAKTMEDMAVKVKTGRAPESELLKIQKSMNDLEQQQDELATKRIDTLKELRSLTGIDLTEPVPMTLIQKPSGDTFLAVTAAQYAAEAAQKEFERRRAARFPTLSVTGFASGNDGEAYNTDKHIYRSYHEIALVLKVPLFDRSISADEALARVQAEKAKKQLAQTKIDSEALAKALSEKLPVIEHSIEVAEKSVSNTKQLLEIAKVALNAGRMIVEEYLRYESDVLAAESTLYQTRHQLWETVAQQAILYGTDLRGVVK